MLNYVTMPKLWFVYISINYQKSVYLCRTISCNGSFMSSEGLYRRNGNLATIQSLRFSGDKGKLQALDEVKDVHILTGLIKLFFK